MSAEEDRKAAKLPDPPVGDRGEREARDPSRDSRLPLEKVLPEILKRGLSAGRDVGESFFPKELASNIASQLVDARHGLVNAIANEVGRFLRQADIASEVRKVLAGLNVEATVHLKFSEDESGKIKSRVDIDPPSARRNRSTPPPESDK
ncbi:MAG TPA: hypothetical protein VHM19_18690 [Polyangiales bacterium]|jgi:hypothetical protein|nr:hypothetical protein [Polyangiales bacterium]